jgi:hypothetical protein
MPRREALHVAAGLYHPAYHPVARDDRVSRSRQVAIDKDPVQLAHAAGRHAQQHVA